MTQNLRPNRPIQKTIPVTIVSLGRYLDLFEGLDTNVKTNGYEGYGKVFVRDGALIESVPGWKLVEGPQSEGFSYAKNLNLGLRACDPESDIFVISDDVRLKGPGTIETLQREAHSLPEIGMLSPRIDGGADNPIQTSKNIGIVFSNRYLAMACFYLKKEILRDVGFLDEERFCGGYGWDDVDYCRRIALKGFKLAVSNSVEVKHGMKRLGTESFIRNAKGYYDSVQKQADSNESLYFQKWNDRKKENW